MVEQVLFVIVEVDVVLLIYEIVETGGVAVQYHFNGKTFSAFSFNLIIISSFKLPQSQHIRPYQYKSFGFLFNFDKPKC